MKAFAVVLALGICAAAPPCVYSVDGGKVSNPDQSIEEAAKERVQKALSFLNESALNAQASASVVVLAQEHVNRWCINYLQDHGADGSKYPVLLWATVDFGPKAKDFRLAIRWLDPIERPFDLFLCNISGHPVATVRNLISRKSGISFGAYHLRYVDLTPGNDGSIEAAGDNGPTGDIVGVVRIGNREGEMIRVFNCALSQSFDLLDTALIPQSEKGARFNLYRGVEAVTNQSPKRSAGGKLPPGSRPVSVQEIWDGAGESPK